MNAEQPLSGKRIVITRSIEQARDLKDRLEKLGATILLLPAVSFSEPADFSELDRALRSIGSFDWILFTSANAVRFFAGRRNKLGVAAQDAKQPQCAAVGPATAAAAAAEGFHVDYQAREFVGSALARELGTSLSGKRVLLPRSDRAGRDLPDALKMAGAHVIGIVAYRTGGIAPADPAVSKAVREGRVDVISFFSPSAVENLREELGANELAGLAQRVAFAAVGPVTAAAMRKEGLSVAIQAPEATAESMTAAIVQYFSAHAAVQARTS